MNTLYMKVPSKTFLLGEYVALAGGPSLILSTEPFFECIITRKPDALFYDQDIHPNSPAGKLIQAYPNFYRNYAIRFIDPYQGIGGLGASTAQFIMTYCLKLSVKQPINDQEILKEYKKLAWNGKGTVPSGADLIAQVHGGICFFYKKLENQVKTFSWPFTNLGYALIHTGNKLETHKHLEELPYIYVDQLEKIVWEGLESIKNKNSKQFIKSINDYAKQLKHQDLVSEHTEHLIQSFSECKKIVAAKGCGALGADIVLVLFEIQDQNQVVDWLKGRQLNVIGYGQKVALGLNNCHDVGDDL